MTANACTTAANAPPEAPCAFECKANSSAKTAACIGKTYGVAGETTVECTDEGAIKVTAKLHPDTLKNAARAYLRFGFNSSMQFRLPGLPAEDQVNKTTYPQFFGRVDGAIGKDGTITAEWDQYVLVAEHSGGRSLLFTRRTVGKEVDNNEVPVDYGLLGSSTCPCMKAADKGYSDADKDKVPDCLNNCVDKKLVGDGTCQHGVKLGANFKCAEHDWDGGDCTDCPAQTHIRDCQGNCFKATILAAALGNHICNDGRQDLVPATPLQVQGPNLRCATYAFDGGDCAGNKPSAPWICRSMNTRVDCEHQCATASQLVESPPGQKGQKCRPWYDCERFGWDGGICKPPGSAKCPGD